MNYDWMSKVTCKCSCLQMKAPMKPRHYLSCDSHHVPIEKKKRKKTLNVMKSQYTFGKRSLCEFLLKGYRNHFVKDSAVESISNVWQNLKYIYDTYDDFLKLYCFPVEITMLGYNTFWYILYHHQFYSKLIVLLRTIRAYWSKRRVVPPVLFRTNYYSIEILHGVTAIILTYHPHHAKLQVLPKLIVNNLWVQLITNGVQWLPSL